MNQRLTPTLSISVLLLSPWVNVPGSTPRVVQSLLSSGASVAAGAKCEAIGITEIRLDCTYPLPTAEAAKKQAGSGIFLRRAEITFEPVHESRMRLKLSFLNKTAAPMKESRTVYIAFDDAAGQNHIRRPLPHVALQKLVPGERMTFEDEFLAPALEPGRYTVRLWIPDPDSRFKADATHSLLLANEGIAEPTLGSNRIATVIVEKTTLSEAGEDH